MNLREIILAEHSKAQTGKVIARVGKSQQRFVALFFKFLHDEYWLMQRAAWPVSYCVITYPTLLKNIFGG